MVSAGHVSGTRGSDIVYNAADVLGMSGVGGVCEMCMCLARGKLESTHSSRTSVKSTKVFYGASQSCAATLTHYSTEAQTTGPDYDPLLQLVMCTRTKDHPQSDIETD